MLTSRDIKQSLNLGMETELIWLTQNCFFIVQPVGNDYFIYACLKATGSNPGVARIEMNKAKAGLNSIIYAEK
jgi:hypothetical protein